MNVSEIKSLAARSVLLDVILNYGETYGEAMAHLNIKRRALLYALNELVSLGLVQKFQVEGERRYRLRATLPEPIAETTILERCIKADETGDLGEKIKVILSAIEEVFPLRSYDGKQPGIKQAVRWLDLMGGSALKLYGQGFAPHSFPARLDKEITCCSKGESKPPGAGTKNGYFQRLSHSSSERPLLWFALLLSVLSSLERRTRDEG